MEVRMFRSALLASVCVMLMASAALAEAPSSLMKGNWSISYTADSGTALGVGYQIKDMSKIAVDFGVSNEDFTSAIDDSLDTSRTEFQIGVSYHYYLKKLSNQYFAPFIGGRFGYADSGYEGTNGDLEIEGRFGGEAFPIAPLSVGGFIGLGYRQDNDAIDNLTGASADGDVTTFGTIRSAFFVSLYW
jgi:hypothetical protein